MKKNKLYLFIILACFVGYGWLFFLSQIHHQTQEFDVTVCLLKIAAAKVALDSFTAVEQNPSSISIKSKPTVAQAQKQTKPFKTPEIEVVFENKKIINS